MQPFFDFQVPTCTLELGPWGGNYAPVIYSWGLLILASSDEWCLIPLKDVIAPIVERNKL